VARRPVVARDKGVARFQLDPSHEGETAVWFKTTLNDDLQQLVRTGSGSYTNLSQGTHCRRIFASRQRAKRNQTNEPFCKSKMIRLTCFPLRFEE
jgi:hypothetical protein